MGWTLCAIHSCPLHHSLSYTERAWKKQYGEPGTVAYLLTCKKAYIILQENISSSSAEHSADGLTKCMEISCIICK